MTIIKLILILLTFSQAMAQEPIPMDKQFADESRPKRFGLGFYDDSKPVVTYLQTSEKAAFRAEVKEGKIYVGGKLYNTDMSRRPPHTIFILDTDGHLYLADIDDLDKFHHSSFNRGRPVLAAGEMYIKEGKIFLISNSSGHYAPPFRSLEFLVEKLEIMGVEGIKDVELLDDAKIRNSAIGLIGENMTYLQASIVRCLKKKLLETVDF